MLRLQSSDTPVIIILVKNYRFCKHGNICKHGNNQIVDLLTSIALHLLMASAEIHWPGSLCQLLFPPPASNNTLLVLLLELLDTYNRQIDRFTCQPQQSQESRNQRDEESLAHLRGGVATRNHAPANHRVVVPEQPVLVRLPERGHEPPGGHPLGGVAVAAAMPALGRRLRHGRSSGSPLPPPQQQHRGPPPGRARRAGRRQRAPLADPGRSHRGLAGALLQVAPRHWELASCSASQ